MAEQNAEFAARTRFAPSDLWADMPGSFYWHSCAARLG
jgi:hypothetical protein